MNRLKDYMTDKLNELDSTCDYEAFQSVLIKLFNQQSLWGAEHIDKKEQRMYLIAESVYDLLDEVVEVMGCQLYRNSAWQLIYLMPGSASHALFEAANDDIEENFTFKRLVKNEISLVISLRYIYQQSINNGDLSCNQASVTIGEINHTHYNLFGSYLPETQASKQQLFKSLKRLRVIEFKDLATADDIVMINVLVLLYDLSGLNEDAQGRLKEIEKVSTEVTDEA